MRTPLQPLSRSLPPLAAAGALVEDEAFDTWVRGRAPGVPCGLLVAAAWGGHGENLIRQRMAFHNVMRDRFEYVVEEATGRKIVGFMSGNQQDPT